MKFKWSSKYSSSYLRVGLSLSQKSSFWQEKFKLKSPSFATKATNYYLDITKDSPEAKKRLEQWKHVLKIFPKEGNWFCKQSGKMQTHGNQALVDSLGASNYLSAGLSNTVGLKLSELPLPFICLDIDVSEVGHRILDLFNGKFKEDLAFENIFQKPIMTASSTKGHLHLFYLCPNKLPDSYKTNHSVFEKSSRLGFPIEYRFQIVTFAGISQALVTCPSSLKEVSYLPKILWPYNGTSATQFTNNLRGIRSKGPAEVSKTGLIPKGRRHNTLYNWTNQDNFSLEEVKAMFYLTCDDLKDTLKLESYAMIMHQNSLKNPKSQPNSYRRKYWHLFDIYNHEGQIPTVEIKGLLPLFGQSVPSSFSKQEKETVEETFDENANETFEEPFVDLNELYNPNENLAEDINTDPTIPKQESFVMKPPHPPKTPAPLANNPEESYRLRPQDGELALDYAGIRDMRLIPSAQDLTILRRLSFSPDRIYQSIVHFQTPKEVILFVAGIENREDIFFEDDDWLGQNLEIVVLTYLLKQKAFDIIFLVQDKVSRWYLFDNISWVQASQREILDFLYPFFLNLNLGGLEKRMDDQDTIKALSLKVKKEIWPNFFNGITFANGTLSIDSKNNPILLPHNPDHFIRQRWMVNYDLNAWLTPIECKFLEDCCAGQTRLIHILRLMIFLIFVQGNHQLGFFIHGAAGGSKTTLMNYLKGLDVTNQSTIDPRTVSQNSFQKGDLVANKSLLFVPDVSPGSLGKVTVDFLKTLLGRDSQVGEKKYGESWNFISQALLMIVSNYSPSQIPAFKDPAVYQRIIYFPAPSILEDYRVSRLESLLLENPAGMINWALNIPVEFASRNIRASRINEALSPSFSSLDNFIESCVAKESQNFVSNTDLMKAYSSFVESKSTTEKDTEKNQDLKTAKIDVDSVNKVYDNLLDDSKQKRSFLGQFRSRLYKFNKHGITENRHGKNRVRGFINMKLVDFQTLLSPAEKMTRGSDLESYLDSSPFDYKGILLIDPKTQRFKQSNPYNQALQPYAEKTLFLVHNHRFQTLLNPNLQPSIGNSHLVINEDSSGQNLEDTFQWDTSKSMQWNSKLDPNKPIAKNTLSSFNIPRLSIPENASQSTDSELDQEKVEIDESQTDASTQDFSEESIIPSDPEEVGWEPDSENFEESFENETISDEDTSLEDEPDDKTPPESKAKPPKTPKSAGKSKNLKSSTPPKTTRGRKKKEQESLDKSDPDNKSAFSFEDLQMFSNVDFQLNEFEAFNFCLEKARETIQNDLKPLFQDAFYKAKNLLKENSSTISDLLDSAEFQPYTTFGAPYMSASLVKQALNQFRFFPQLATFDFINLFNKYFRQLILKRISAVRYYQEPDQHSFFGRRLPGSQNLFKPKEQFFELNETHFGYERAQELDSQWDGASLFPVGYDFGDKSYGRFLSVPRSTCSTMKHEVKSIILNNVAKSTGLNFAELDLKSCHTVIYQNLSFEISHLFKAEIPDPVYLWSTLTSEFKKQRDAIEYSSSQFEQIIKSWDDNQIKKILKGQWYKGLNAGNVFHSPDVLSNARNSLNIPNKEEVQANPQLGLSDKGDFDFRKLAFEVEKINRKIAYFEDLSKFNDLINENEEIYLPTQEEPFFTKTLSKKQELASNQLAKLIEKGDGQGLQSSSFKRSGKTGMSRIFSTCEVVLVMIVWMVLDKFPDLMPLSYEADGLLLVGYIQDKTSLLDSINQEFAKLSRLFVEGNHVLEFKEIYGDLAS